MGFEWGFSLMLAGILSAAASGVSQATAEFHGIFTNTTANSAATRTFSSVPFGSSTSDRILVVGCLSYLETSLFPTVTVSGTDLTLESASWINSQGTSLHAYHNFSDAATSGTIEVTPAAFSNGVIIGVWSVRGGVKETDFKASNFYPDTTDTLDSTDKGVVIGIAGGTATATGSFSLLELNTVDFDTYSSTNGISLWGGRETWSSTVSSKTINASGMLGTSWSWNAISFAPT